MRLALLKIEWYDLWGITTHRTPGMILSELKHKQPYAYAKGKGKPNLIKITSVGYLVKNHADHIELAMNITSAGQRFGIVTIPKEAIDNREIIIEADLEAKVHASGHGGH
jgi:hypothetical protein